MKKIILIVCILFFGACKTTQKFNFLAKDNYKVNANWERVKQGHCYFNITPSKNPKSVTLCLQTSQINNIEKYVLKDEILKRQKSLKSNFKDFKMNLKKISANHYEVTNVWKSEFVKHKSKKKTVYYLQGTILKTFTYSGNIDYFDSYKSEANEIIKLNL